MAPSERREQEGLEGRTVAPCVLADTMAAPGGEMQRSKVPRKTKEAENALRHLKQARRARNIAGNLTRLARGIEQYSCDERKRDISENLHIYDKIIYKERNVVERLFQKLKHYRRIATRYERLARNDRAMLSLVATVIWLE